MFNIQNGDSVKAPLLVVGGGIAGITAAVETAEVGRDVILIEKEAFLGGRVAQMNQYFPKLCPPSCGMEINFRRIKDNKRIKYFTLAAVESVSGEPGNYKAEIKITPRYVADTFTAGAEAEAACSVEVPNKFNFGIDNCKVINKPSMMSFPNQYVIDAEEAGNDKVKSELGSFDGIDLNMQEIKFTVECESIVWATGWSPYDAAKIENLGFGTVPNVITNVMMERLAHKAGPTGGKIVRPSDSADISSIAFVQCAGSRDENHLPYCSGVCCLASMKQATYVRENYPDAEIHIFYIDVRSPGRMEDFYTSVDSDEKIHFHRGKAAAIKESGGKVMITAENTLTGDKSDLEVDMAVLATGMVPNSALEKPPVDVELDENGFIVSKFGNGIIGTGTAVRPVDVASSVQDATGAAIKAMQFRGRS